MIPFDFVKLGMSEKLHPFYTSIWTEILTTVGISRYGYWQVLVRGGGETLDIGISLKKKHHCYIPNRNIIIHISYCIHQIGFCVAYFLLASDSRVEGVAGHSEVPGFGFRRQSWFLPAEGFGYSSHAASLQGFE